MNIDDLNEQPPLSADEKLNLILDQLKYVLDNQAELFRIIESASKALSQAQAYMPMLGSLMGGK